MSLVLVFGFIAWLLISVPLGVLFGRLMADNPPRRSFSGSTSIQREPESAARQPSKERKAA